MDKLEKRIREIEEEHSGEVVEQRTDEWIKRRQAEAFKIIGGLQMADRVADILSAETMRSLIRFQKEKRHKDLGYPTFMDFLEAEMPTFGKDKFYRRKELLEKEGDPIFDLFNTIGLSARKRKFLGKGNVEFDGEKVIVHDGDDQTEIDITDRTRLLETLSALADANADKTSTVEKQKAKIDKHDDEKRELYEEIDRVKAAKAAEIGKDPHSMALANLCFAFAALRDEIANLTVVDCEARCSNTLEILAGQMSLTSRAYGGSGDWAAEVTESSGGQAGENDDLLQMLADVDLSRTPGDNDAELAASM